MQITRCIANYSCTCDFHFFFIGGLNTMTSTYVEGRARIPTRIQSTFLDNISVTLLFILFPHLCHSLPCSLFPSGFLTQIFYEPSVCSGHRFTRDCCKNMYRSISSTAITIKQNNEITHSVITKCEKNAC